MDAEFLDLTAENLAEEHLCCIIRSRKPHPGVEAKRRWLKQRLRERHVFRKLKAKATVLIEYAPLETAWVPIVGETTSIKSEYARTAPVSGLSFLLGWKNEQTVKYREFCKKSYTRMGGCAIMLFVILCV